jgi:predicted Zn-dependent peptidase
MIKKVVFFTLIFLEGVLMSAEVKSINIKEVDIPLIFEKSTLLPTFDLKLVFTNAGYISDKKSGVAKLSANILNEGTKELGNIEFAKKLENRAISLSVVNGFETFVFEVSSLKSEYKYAIDSLNELILSPNLTRDSLKKVKLMNTSQLLRKENDFDYIASKNLVANLFKNTPYENGSIKDRESVENIYLKDIREFLNTHINLSNLIVVAGGDVDLDEIKEAITPLLNSLKVGSKIEYPKFTANSDKEYIESIKETQQAYIYFGSKFNLDSKDKDRYKAKVAGFILGSGGFGSRIMEEIRVKRGLAYSAYSRFNINKTNSYFSGYLQTKLDKKDEAITVVKELLEDFIKNGVTKDELQSAKDFLIGSEPLRNETLSQRLSREFKLYYQGLEPSYLEEELQNIKKLKLKELNRFIKEHSEILDLTISVVTNSSKEEEEIKIIEDIEKEK